MVHRGTGEKEGEGVGGLRIPTKEKGKVEGGVRRRDPNTEE